MLFLFLIFYIIAFKSLIPPQKQKMYIFTTKTGVYNTAGFNSSKFQPNSDIHSTLDCNTEINLILTVQKGQNKTIKKH